MEDWVEWVKILVVVCEFVEVFIYLRDNILLEDYWEGYDFVDYFIKCLFFLDQEQIIVQVDQEDQEGFVFLFGWQWEEFNLKYGIYCVFIDYDGLFVFWNYNFRIKWEMLVVMIVEQLLVNLLI